MPGFNLDPQYDIDGITSGLGQSQKIVQKQPPLPDLNGWQKAGLLLQNFSAGMEGKPLKSDELIKQREEQKRKEIEDLKNVNDVVVNSLKTIRSLPVDKREEAVRIMSEKLDGIAPGMGEVFKSYNANPVLEDGILNMFGKDKGALVQSIHFDYCGGDRDCTLKMMGDKDFMERITKSREQEIIPSVNGKLDSIVSSVDKFLSPQSLSRFKRDADGNLLMNVEDLRRVNDQAPEDIRLSDAEFGVLERNQNLLLRHGIVTDDLLKDKRKEDLTGDPKVKAFRLPNGELVSSRDGGRTVDTKRGRVPLPAGAIPVSVSGGLGEVSGTGMTKSQAGEEIANLRKSEIAVRKSLALADDIEKIVGDNEGALSFTGALARGIDTFSAQVVQSANLLGVDASSASMDEKTYSFSKFPKTAADSAEFRSVSLALARALAAVNGEEGKALSNEDVQQYLDQIGAGAGSGNQFKRVIKDVKNRIKRDFKIQYKVIKGEDFKGFDDESQQKKSPEDELTELLTNG